MSEKWRCNKCGGINPLDKVECLGCNTPKSPKHVVSNPTLSKINYYNSLEYGIEGSCLNALLLILGLAILIVEALIITEISAPIAVRWFFASAQLVFGGIILYCLLIRSNWDKKYKDLESSHQNFVAKLKRVKIHEWREIQCKTWLDSLKLLTWQDNTPEVEVEIKFIYPLLKYLGYKNENITVRVSIPMQEGSAKTVREADWVIWGKDEKALLVIEAKSPKIFLNEGVAKQARSYAFRLGAPAYIISNGKEIQVFYRGIIDDRFVLSCAVNELVDHWALLQSIAGKSKLANLRQKLERNIDD